MSEIPSLLSQSPLFQLEKLRKTTRDAVEEALSAKDVTLREYWVLTCLASAPTTQQAELTEALGIDPSDIVRILDKLVRKGLVTRQRAPEDRRRQVVALKKDGAEAAQEARQQGDGGRENGPGRFLQEAAEAAAENVQGRADACRRRVGANRRSDRGHA